MLFALRATKFTLKGKKHLDFLLNIVLYGGIYNLIQYQYLIICKYSFHFQLFLKAYVIKYMFCIPKLIMFNILAFVVT